MNLLDKINKKNWIIILLLSLFLLIVFISAWLCDDAYITFRTIDNFINGYGLTWNISERVQAYTHPLWMFLLSAFYFFTNEIYYTSIIISIIISCLSVFLLLNKLSNSLLNSILVGLILIFSKSFIDFSTSGLENPLSHLLIILFFIVYFKNADGEKKLLMLSLITSFAILNRMDLILIFLPSLLLTYLKGNRLKGILILLTGFLPFIIWEIFSLFYYGFLFPNTAYAKLNTGISTIELAYQGLIYLLNSVYLDPITPFVITVAFLIPFITKNKSMLPLLIGLALYLIYIINIGGDFMSGRFLSAPLVCSSIILLKIEIKSYKKLSVGLAMVIVVGLLSPKPTIFYNKYYGLGPKIIKAFRFGPFITQTQDGIADERFWYYNNAGLLNNISEKNLFSHNWVRDGIYAKENNLKLVVRGTIGYYGFFAGKNVHVIDPYSLTESLLARLPATEYWRNLKSGIDTSGLLKEKFGEKKWRIGHFTRKIPGGYVETLISGENKIKDSDLRKYYDKLSLVIKGNLFDAQRLKEIININFGKYDYLIDEYEKKLLNDRESVSK